MVNGKFSPSHIFYILIFIFFYFVEALNVIFFTFQFIDFFFRLVFMSFFFFKDLERKYIFCKEILLTLKFFRGIKYSKISYTRNHEWIMIYKHRHMVTWYIIFKCFSMVFTSNIIIWNKRIWKLLQSKSPGYGQWNANIAYVYDLGNHP